MTVGGFAPYSNFDSGNSFLEAERSQDDTSENMTSSVEDVDTPTMIATIMCSLFSFSDFTLGRIGEIWNQQSFATKEQESKEEDAMRLPEQELTTYHLGLDEATCKIFPTSIQGIKIASHKYETPQYPFPSVLAWSIGRRKEMEDAHCEQVPILFADNENKQRIGYLWGICDGHGGDLCAKFVIDQLPQVIHTVLNSQPIDTENKIAMANALTEAIALIQKAWKEERKRGGCCATFIFKIEQGIYSINIGDSRALIRSRNKNIQLTTDASFLLGTLQIPSQAILSMRAGKLYQIENNQEIEIPNFKQYGINEFAMYSLTQGGMLINDAYPSEKMEIRLFVPENSSSLEPAAVIGDHDRFLHVMRTPTIKYFELKNQNKADNDFIVLACDGLWETLSSEYVMDYIARATQAQEKLLKKKASEEDVRAAALELIGKELIRSALLKGSHDNISLILIDLRPEN